MNHPFWQQIKRQIKIWRSGALPGLVVISCVVVVRLTGSLQVLEWMAFDQLLRSRPVESADQQIVIVGINEDDIKAVGKYPIPDRELAKLLRTLQSYRPRAIGLDIFRDLTTGHDRAELAEILSNSSNLMGIEAALSSQSALTVKPPPELPINRVGIADAIIDPDGKLRRSLLASKVGGRTRYSLSLLVATLYLKSKGIPLQHGSHAGDPIGFGAVSLPRFRKNTGGYVNAKAGGNQILLNFRSHPHPFTIVSLTDVMAGQVKPEIIRDHIVFVGMVAASVNDTFITSATKGTLLSNALKSSEQYQLLYGMEYQAHATSQIVNAVLNGRPLLQSWSKGWEYVWILGWGLFSIALGLILQSPWKTLLSLAVSSVCLVAICAGLLILGWWVPLVPALLALCAAGLTTSLFDHNCRVLLEQRSLTLKRTYDAVHNGPLQTLAAILRGTDEMPLVMPLRAQLESLNQELRSVYESMKQELSTGNNRFIQTPLPELLYEVYETTLQRDLPGFRSIKTYIPPDFSPLKDCVFTVEQKQGLCIFLQEALCNVGKHAIEASRLDITCTHPKNEWRLQIINNGLNCLNIDQAQNGRGTDQAKELARSLGGKFQRRYHSSQGVICELIWRTSKPWWQFFSHPFGL